MSEYSGDGARRVAAIFKVLALGGLLLLLGLGAVVLQRGADVASLAGFGYPGITLLMFLSSGTVLLPAPGFAAVVAAGTVWNPLLVGIAAGVGSATGELTGYLLGIGGEAVLHMKDNEKWRRAHRWLGRHGFLAILLLASVPNPLFDAMGLVAGSLAYPIRRFWLACVLGNSIKYSAIASATAWWLNQ